MGGLRPVPARKLLRALAKAGFQPVSQRRSHLKLRHADGRIVVVPAHPGRPLKVGILRAVLAQARIEPDEFLRDL